MASLVIAFAIDDAKAMIVPAVCKALIRIRAIVPKNAPISISPINSRTKSGTAAGITGKLGTKGGETTKLIAMAIAKVNLGETKEEPKPGIIDMADPTRAKIRKKPNILSSRRSLSIPATQD